MLNRRYTIAWFLLFSALLLRPAVRGQTVVPSDDELKSKKKIYYINLDWKSKETAESYIYILEQLDLLTADYARYFSGCDIEIAAGYLTGLKQLAGNLSKGAYLKNITNLENDLNILKNNLQSRNAELKEIAACRREYRLGRHLHDELKTVQMLLQGEVAMQYALESEELHKLELYLQEREVETQKRILKYYKTSIKPKVREIGTDRSGKIAVVFDTEIETIISIVTRSDEPEGVAVEPVLAGAVPKTFTIGEVSSTGSIVPPQTPHAPVAFVVETNRIHFSESGDVWNTRTLIDSSRELSKTTPIFINNPTGNLTVTGWDRDYLLAEAEVTVSSGTEERARKFSDKIELILYLKNGRIYVETEIPRLVDIHTRIISNKVVVKVPSENRVVCKNSFGSVDIMNLNGALKLMAEYSRVTLSQIEGDVVAINSNGPVDASHISGLLKLKNSSGRITVSNSSGTMELENLFAPIELSDSDGDVVIRCAGPVMVKNHRGDVTIINKEGKTEVNRIDGNLFVNNSFGPLLVDQVSGDASIENNGSRINVGGVSGRLTVTNRFAPISISSLIGPIDIDNNNGNINVYLSGDFDGISTIRSTSGTVNLYVMREPNLVVRASTTRGEIRSFFPLHVSQTGQESRATHTFGDGRNQLTVSGTGSTIIFSNAN